MATELLIASNPSKRRRKQSPKQRAASLRNLSKARRARKPRKRARRRSNPVGEYLSLAGNPRRRKRRASSVARRSVKRRRNPSFSLRKLSPRGLLNKAMPALIGGGGAVANDLLYNLALNAVPATVAPDLIANLRTGQLRHVGKALSAIALSMLAGFVLPRRIAEQMGTGALVVVGYNVVREGVTKFFPDAGMGMYLEPGGLGWAGAGWNPAYGRGADWEAGKAGLAAYLQPRPGNGNNGLNPQTQFKTTAAFTARPAVYADELEA